MNRYHRTELKVWLIGKAGSESLGLDGLVSALLRARLHSQIQGGYETKGP